MSKGKMRLPRTAGYTLSELLVVLAILSAVAAFAWPNLRRTLGRSELTEGAKQVRIALAKARLKAIESGTSQLFRFQPGRAIYEVAPLKTGQGDEQVAIGTVGDLATWLPRDSFLEDATSHPDAVRDELPAGVHFADAPERPGISEAPSTNAQLQDELLLDDQGAWAPPIVFLPDGRSKDALVRLHGQRNYRMNVLMRGMTGEIRIGELQREEQPDTTQDPYRSLEEPL